MNNGIGLQQPGPLFYETLFPGNLLYLNFIFHPAEQEGENLKVTRWPNATELPINFVRLSWGITVTVYPMAYLVPGPSF